MKPARFDYVRAESIAHAVEVLGEAGGDAKVIAGGQSLIPMMNFRLVKPSVLVDINRIDGLDRITEQDGRLMLGALVRHRMTAEDRLVAARIPVLHQAMKHVAHLTVRNRGTFCGSVCHADPAAEMPMMVLLLDGIIHVAARRGTRTVKAADFFQGSLVTALEPDEMVTGIEVAIPEEGSGWAFEEFARRHGDYALAAVAVILQRLNGAARNVRIAMMGVSEMPLRLGEIERALEGRPLDAAACAMASDMVRDTLMPNSDLNASADYRRHLAGVLVHRALIDAWARATEVAA